mmetsp:Transcript_25492/g.59066  ORF Transcript_25492/g.59066 Transcript_25492/m.59066 type:complete len:328 (-) Transcript_25492:179-1162(-)
MAVAGFVQLGGAAEECGLGAVAGKRLGATVDGETECISSRGGRVWAARALRPGDMELERCQEGAEDAWAAHAPGQCGGPRVGEEGWGSNRCVLGVQGGDLVAGGLAERRQRQPRQLEVPNPAIVRLREVSRSASPAGMGRRRGSGWSSCSSPRGACGGPESMLVDTGRSTSRSLAIIAVALVALTAASVPKLTRMDIDVDYSPMMRDCKLSLDALARPPPQPHRSSERWSSPASPSVDTVRSATDMLTGASHHAEAKKGGDVHSLRLRGGEKSPQFTPSQSSHDLRVRGGCGSPRSCQTEDGGTLSPDFFAAGRRYQPKLSRTVDAH